METTFYTANQLEALKKALNDRFEIAPEHRTDFITLQEKINEALKKNGIKRQGKDGKEHDETIGEGSIQNLWSYRKKEMYTSFSRRILNIFVKSLTPSYQDWESFIKTLPLPPSSKEKAFDPRSIIPEDLKIGEIVTLGWKDIQYYAQVEYLGDYNFKIKKTKGLGRKAGTTFNARRFLMDLIVFEGTIHPTPSILIWHTNNSVEDLDRLKQL